eukprot:CAMPEP_0177675032 /NCGR_PEP_ID=MMETSP0447-20121125/26943_1 /TAXON_ID=0 /ORGANISM="Stygamoeba regulata, Strain BSH-02190019" /LENGTH=252 /DNA_ID=CAMNT_0019183309 /DNA_START=194 /DNA_END=949 /DNA_ORIENTATION=+
MAKKKRVKQHKVWRERKQRRDQQRRRSSLTHLQPTSLAARAVASSRSASSGGGGGGGDGCGSGRLWVTNYTSRQSILVVGDGDFSFSRGLVQHRGSGRLLVLTAYDSRAVTLAKYQVAERILGELEKADASVFFGVDATRLDRTLPRSEDNRIKLRKGSMAAAFDRIVFNFPHTGKQRVHLNRNLLRNFFASAKPWLKQGGEIHVTLKERLPYTGWNVEEQATLNDLQLKVKLDFDPDEFPGYHHHTTDPTA